MEVLDVHTEERVSYLVLAVGAANVLRLHPLRSKHTKEKYSSVIAGTFLAS